MEIEPPSRIYGEDPPPPLIGGENLTQVKGLAASNGYYKGRLRHVKSISDFTHVEPGDVVVVPFSDISWSPLFVKSGAIISESGGVLSHAAVIAREFRIPAVLSVEGAFRLPDGQMVVVDGFTGTITVV